MRATKVLQKCLGDALGSMHALRSRVLLRAVEAMTHGSRLTLIDLGRVHGPARSVSAPRSRRWIGSWATAICMSSANTSTRP